VIIGKTPARDGRSGSKFSGGKRKSGPSRDFLKLLEDAMVPLFDSCIDEACVHVVERNLDRDPWKKYFAKDGNDDYLEYIDADAREQFVKALQDSLPTRKNKPCAWLFFNRIIDGGFPPLRKGTTPQTYEKVPGTNNFRPKSSDGYSFISDKASGVEIAHEIVHQAGATHSKDNMVPPDVNGEPDANKPTPGNARGKGDLMEPFPKEGDKLADPDCAKLRAYIKDHKCCDED
jgi:hypothetical protein